MPEHAGKILLGENHRLAVSVVIRGTERACECVLEMLERRGTLMNELREDIAPEEQAGLRELAGELKEEIRKLGEKIELEKNQTSRRRTIAALLSAALIDLQETEDSGLRGYGELSPQAKKTLYESIDRMTALLEEMLAIAERR